MRRLQLIELEDQLWFPIHMRNCMTDLLNFLITFFRIYDSIVPLLLKAMHRSSSSRLVDLCSGGGGAILRVQQLLMQKYRFVVRVTMSDLYPNEHACARIKALHDLNTSYLPHAIDATKVPRELEGFRTLFTSFHHFDPHSAQKILRDAINQGQGIGIFELSERNIRGFMGPVFSVILSFLATPFLKPFSLRRLFLTYIIPIVPAAFLFDGIISQLRSYTYSEMLDLAREVDSKNIYHWEAGYTKHKFLPFRINYLVGYKSANSVSPFQACPK